jgi:hypothetical protein
VQKHIFKHNLVSQEEVSLFNSISLEYKSIKSQMQKIDAQKRQKRCLNKEILNLCLEPLDFGTIETDAKQSIKCRQRATVNEQSQNPFVKLDEPARSLSQ